MAAAAILVTGSILFLLHRSTVLQKQVIDQRREIDGYFHYVYRRDAVWEPHIIAIPVPDQP
jgi:hypothetical protein